MLNVGQPADAALTIDHLLQPIGLARFLADYYHRLPVALAGAVPWASSLAPSAKFVTILQAEGCDWMVARKGNQLAVPSRIDRDGLETFMRDGYTLLVRHAERHDEELGQLADVFGQTFRAPVDLHLYATPPDQYGFSWHYDPEDVFLLQVQGEKEFMLRKNTVHPWPVTEAIPEDMRYEREIMPLLRVTLRPGDLLYIPCGYWHRGVTPVGQEIAISISIGLMARTALDLLDQLRPQLVASLLCRQRLPIAFVANTNEDARESIEATYRYLLTQVARELSNLLQSESLIKQLTEESLIELT